MSQTSLFDIEKKLEELSSMGDPLEKLSKTIPWERFEKPLAKVFEKERKSNAGRRPYPYLSMFKVMILQNLYNIADEQMQFQMLDRLTFRRFTGFHGEDTIPDQKTIWLYREHLTQSGIIEKLFTMFDNFLADAGYRAKKGQIVDASFVEVPRQRNTKDENDTINKGETPENWNESKRRQKDMDAAWTKKHNETHFGYKNHVNVDVQHKMIRAYSVTPASVHDSQELENIIDKDSGRKALWGDSAYSSKSTRKKLNRKRIVSHINKKGYRNHPLSKFQQSLNRIRSKVRARVEHVFARIGQMVGGTIRCIGQPRAATRIGIINLVYNMSRFAYLENCR